MNQPIKQRITFEETFGCKYSVFAKRHGLHRDTIRWRWWNGHRTLAELTAPTNSRRIKVGGKTFEQWSAWFAIRNVERTATQLRASWYYYRYTYNLSKTEALARVKANCGLKD
jgi:hypothetical protein